MRERERGGGGGGEMRAKKSNQEIERGERGETKSKWEKE